MNARSLVTAFLLAGALSACSAPQPGASSEASAQPSATASAAPTDSALPVGSVPPTAAPTAAPTTAPTTAPSTEPGGKLAGPYSLTLKQTGGIAGMRMETVIDTATKKINYGGPRNQKVEARDLLPDDIKGLTRVLEAADIETFRKLKGPPVADAFEYTITVTTGGKDYVASWQDGTTAPASFESVRMAVTKLREAKFSSNPTGAPSR
jgi:hypothetical protein